MLHRGQCTVYTAHHIKCRQARPLLWKLLFLFQMFVSFINEELQSVIFFFKVFQQDFFRLVIRAFHVINEEGLEITGYDPARALGIRQFCRIPFCLLERCQECAIGLLYRLPQVFPDSFLFNQHMGFRNMPVHETGMAQLYLLFEPDKFIWVCYAKHVPQKETVRRLVFLPFHSPCLATFLQTPLLRSSAACLSFFFLPINEASCTSRMHAQNEIKPVPSLPSKPCNL